jgi:hypothetical protein
MDIQSTLLDMSYTWKGYPYISVGHISCMGEIFHPLCWTCLIQISAGHVSHMGGISHPLSWMCLIQGKDILIFPLEMSHAAEGYPIPSAGHVSYRERISSFLCWTCPIQEKDIPMWLTSIIHRIWMSLAESSTSYIQGICSVWYSVIY